MARSMLSAPAVLRAITAAAVITMLTANPASARPDPAASTGAASAPAGCQAADLGISVPVAIAGDPDEGMGKRAWNIVFRNTSKAACSLRGWPRIAVHATGGKPVATTVSDVNYSNLVVVPDTEVVLRARAERHRHGPVRDRPRRMRRPLDPPADAAGRGKRVQPGDGR